jgi:hypothetical protein
MIAKAIRLSVINWTFSCLSPTPLTGAFTIEGTLSGSITCEGRGAIPSTKVLDSTEEEGGTITGPVTFVLSPTQRVTLGLVAGTGTTDGNTFSISGPNGFFLPESFTVSGGCGIGVTVRYEEELNEGTFTGDVTCTLL